MHGLVGRAADRTRQAARRVLDLEHDLASSRLKVHVDHSPRFDESKGLGEERFHRHSVPATVPAASAASCQPHQTRESQIEATAEEVAAVLKCSGLRVAVGTSLVNH